MKKERGIILVFFELFFGILFFGFVLASAPVWQGSNINYTLIEDSTYYHNLSANITGYNNDITFVINTLQTNISWTNANGVHNVTESDISGWIMILDSSTGNLSINATHDNETGFFEIPIEAKNITDNEATTTIFEFIINTTNDAPEFTNIDLEYNLSYGEAFLSYINASDEEEHYPLFFNISFFDNCTLADWSTRGAGNCSIFSLEDADNTSALMNFTPVWNDVGTYWANISVSDFGENYSCPHAYCDASSYEQNQTSYYSVKFNIFSSLGINASDCQNKIFQENESGGCYINITTKGQEDSLNISGFALLRNYNADVYNASWFYPENLTDSSNFTLIVYVNVTPQKTEIGNWTINFTVGDFTFDEMESELIYVYVNRTSNSAPNLMSINDLNTSIYYSARINLTVYDDDLLIPDKNQSFGGYNETISFDVQILNQSNLTQELLLNGFDVEILHMPVSGTNRTEAKIEFTPNETETGNYTINISISDLDNSADYELFNLTIINNTPPYWIEPLQTNFSIWEKNETYLNLSLNITDDEEDELTFSFANDTSFPSFNLNETTGIINFTPANEDVGQHLINITISDGYLTNTTEFNFTVYNVNDPLVIETPLLVVNASIDENSNINASENNYTTISLYVYDDDFKIPFGQKSFYNESLILNLTIQGPNPTLFDFVNNLIFENLSIYEAVFTPENSDVGGYNITINISDASNISDILTFNLTVFEISHAPVLMELTNQTSAVNRTLYYRINVTDTEDGNSSEEGNINFTFSYNFLSGTDFINDNQTIFNFTTGELNITFNDTHAGLYHLNITVNDSGSLEDSDDFWIFVYNSPNVNFPSSEETFTLQENATSNLTFQGNHSIGDNLTYLFYIDSALRYNISYYGNATNLTWQFTPDFTDETYGDYKNLTLIIYPTNNELENNSALNITLNWSVNITHANSPIVFSGHIGDKQADYNQDITINLFDYFSDIDYNDSYYNQTINFTAVSNGSYIGTSVSNGILTLSSGGVVTELMSLNASDLNSSDNSTLTTAMSNNFIVKFTAPTTVPTPSPSGGGSRKIPISLKIIIPEPISIYQKDRIIVPITLYNNGEIDLTGIILTSTIAKDNLIRDDIVVSFDKSHFSSLVQGQKENVTLTIDVNTSQTGLFEVTIHANVTNPEYYDWGKLYLTVKEGESILEKLLFAEEFIAENPECVELTEIVREADKYFEERDFTNALLKINHAIDACKNSISQPGRAKIREKTSNKFYDYLLLAMLACFFIGTFYYIYKRIRLKRVLLNDAAKSRNNKFNRTFLVICIGLIGFFAIKTSMAGFVISNLFSENQDKFNLSFIFILGFLGFFLFLHRKNIKKIIRNVKRKNHFGNNLNGLIKKKIYTSSGDYIGKIDNIILKKNKIHSLKIKLDNRAKQISKIKHKGIIVDYNQIKSVGHILLFKGGILKLKRALVKPL